ncbi:MAG: hypothetical protein COV34_01875 [Candidatus Zambryskibacteria bacterium CG10_big_fil_rev_8_21_14_0_10_42_12]|uniref:Right handed beta helix domain-containing protein n=1 Tax=Candidatus Zambryskibacteria bacterium CG10_big_fil_rev_8_21_14_0_10_42_12 TaxID=1975115 RepID=A0A2H0QWY7_9BACT|nr:MAG: hypothetical protein COV34_01875 [Candidatus Zambryskibacteria bacterium CG10_big_fil_rev_8_21_14_0_10_42_12]
MYIENNILENNALEILLTNTDNVFITENTVRHMSTPETDAPRTTLLWFELSNDVVIRNNTFTYKTDVRNKNSFIVYTSSQELQELTFTDNSWSQSLDQAITDQNVLNIR